MGGTECPSEVAAVILRRKGIRSQAPVVEKQLAVSSKLLPPVRIRAYIFRTDFRKIDTSLKQG